MRAVHAFCMECLGMERFDTEKVRNCGGDKEVNGGCSNGRRLDILE